LARPLKPMTGSRPFHSITSSARASKLGGMVRPRVLAVLRLITNSSFVGSSTGRSAGVAPLTIRSTKYAARKWLRLRLSP